MFKLVMVYYLDLELFILVNIKCINRIIYIIIMLIIFSFDVKYG